MTHSKTDIHVLKLEMNEFPGLRSYHSFNDTQTMLHNEPDISSPRLWKPGSPLHSKTLKSVTFSHSNEYQSPPMSPNSRTQAIVRGRKEMMDMVRDLPESFYELSLKDIVEKQSEMDASKEKNVVGMSKMNETKQKNRGKNKGNRKIARSQSIENEKVLLKTSVIFPLFLGSKKKKKGKGGSGSGSGRFRMTVIPKQQPSKGVEKDWWKRRSCMSSESDDSSGLSNSGSSRSSSVSSRSSNSSGRRKNGLLPSFCFFIGRKIKGRKQIHA